MPSDLTNPTRPSAPAASDPVEAASAAPVEPGPMPEEAARTTAPAALAADQTQGLSLPVQPQSAEPSEATALAQQAWPPGSSGAGTDASAIGEIPSRTGAELLMASAEPAGAEGQQPQTTDPNAQPQAQQPHSSSPVPAGPAHGSGQWFHDFRGAPLLTAAELRRAKLKHEEFARALSTRLSIYLRTEFTAQLNSLDVLSHSKFIAALPHPAHFTLFRLEPVSGVGLVGAPLPLSLGLVDRLLGGPGQRDNTDRGPTTVERAVLDLVTTQLLKEWSQVVLGMPDAQPHILGHETNPRFLPVGAVDGHLLQVVMDAQLGPVSDRVHLAFPLADIETVFRQQPPPSQVQQAQLNSAPSEPLEWHPGLNEIPIKISAGWDGLQMTAQQLANLKVGDWLPLDPQQFNRVQVRLARQPKFIGRLGTANRARAIELIGPIESTQPLVS